MILFPTILTTAEWNWVRLRVGLPESQHLNAGVWLAEGHRNLCPTFSGALSPPRGEEVPNKRNLLGGGQLKRL